MFGGDGGGGGAPLSGCGFSPQSHRGHGERTEGVFGDLERLSSKVAGSCLKIAVDYRNPQLIAIALIEGGPFDRDAAWSSKNCCA